jgi:N-acetylglucosamine transport system substrate-binding protein
MLDVARGNTFTWLYSTYYRKLERERVNAATTDLLTRRINAAQWTDRCQQAADQFARDPAVKKYKRA